MKAWINEGFAGPCGCQCTYIRVMVKGSYSLCELEVQLVSKSRDKNLNV